jgi:hypothetical protein
MVIVREIYYPLEVIIVVFSYLDKFALSTTIAVVISKQPSTYPLPLPHEYESVVSVRWRYAFWILSAVASESASIERKYLTTNS